MTGVELPLPLKGRGGGKTTDVSTEGRKGVGWYFEKKKATRFARRRE